MDGGLERLVQILLKFCICPPPPENPALLYGLSPSNARPPKQIPTLNPSSFDKHAAYRFSLAFQCVVNIGIRGSEPIRSRVVQAGTLDVVGCILEAWLAHKGFAVGPSASATGMPRETREQRQVRKLAQQEQRQMADAVLIQRALMREQQAFERFPNRNEIEWDQDTLSRPTPPNLLIPPSSSSSRPSLPRNTTTSSDTGEESGTSADTSTAVTPSGTGTPTGTVLVPGRERSGTVIARTIWDDPPPPHQHRNHHHHHNPHHHHQNQRTHTPESPSLSTDTSRPETETEDDDIEMDRPERDRRRRRAGSEMDDSSARGSPVQGQHPQPLLIQRPRRAVGIVSDEQDEIIPLQLSVDDAHIIINDAQGGGLVVGDVDGVREVGVEDGIVSLGTNDDFAMGAPPGAPGAIPIDDGGGPRNLNINVMGGMGGLRGDERRAMIQMQMQMGMGMHRTATVRDNQPPDVTPRAVNMTLPDVAMQRTGTVRPGRTGGTPDMAGLTPGGPTPHISHATSRSHHRHHHHDPDSGLYRDEDVLLSLQLLAYLSKYPHVRQAFYKPRASFHPATVHLRERGQGKTRPPHHQQQTQPNSGAGATPSSSSISASSSAIPSATTSAGGSNTSSAAASSASTPAKETSGGFFRAFAGVGRNPGPRGKEKEKEVREEEKRAQKEKDIASFLFYTPGAAPTSSSSSSFNGPPRQTNVFSLVERFTFRPSSTEIDLPNPPPKLPPAIQYWAGVIMRNACRKDESRGGIRQCANMLCGRWESYPREFAKCRRCRKAKYCGKECQSTAWSEGHRFWCSIKEDEEEMAEQVSGDNGHAIVEVASDEGGHGHHHHPRMEVNMGAIGGMEGIPPGGAGNATIRLRERERERQARERFATTHGVQGDASAAARAAAFRAALASRGPFNAQLPGHAAAGPSRQVVPSHQIPIQPSRNVRPGDNEQVPVFAAFRNEALGLRRRAETVTGAVSPSAPRLGRSANDRQDVSRSRRRDIADGDDMVLG